jgi:hypothetical protein
MAVYPFAFLEQVGVVQRFLHPVLSVSCLVSSVSRCRISDWVTLSTTALKCVRLRIGPTSLTSSCLACDVTAVCRHIVCCMLGVVSFCCEGGRGYNGRGMEGLCCFGEGGREGEREGEREGGRERRREGEGKKEREGERERPP